MDPLLRDKLHQPQPLLLSGYSCPVPAAEGQLPKWDNVTQGHLKLICNVICNVGYSTFTSHMSSVGATEAGDHPQPVCRV